MLAGGFTRLAQPKSNLCALLVGFAFASGNAVLVA
jgi:hypothetical protein